MHNVFYISLCVQVPLLAFENKYVKHLVGNVLTAVTKFIFLTVCNSTHV